MLTTMKVAIARQTASDSVNFQIARIQRTVQATRDIVMTMNAIHRTIAGFTTPRDSVLKFHNYIGIISLHIPNYNKSILSPVSCLSSPVSSLLSPVSPPPGHDDCENICSSTKAS